MIKKDIISTKSLHKLKIRILKKKKLENKLKANIAKRKKNTKNING